ncbi:rac-like GTP-binding protein ARAC11 [Mizuhopecten yessoensis]|uniref:Rho-related GTP-binding protein RhoQ n=1 Tax=Mizuhopecten yessoensis TaxID=6573 RepID=A0A210QQ03_MIZYE|nr:rac-like GTP-binding protein ARAC11 [Mizuhopecten yessoensis]OWF50813.1 Rho-related GTP-binding protein RhoQ [Mizuhopecten yessoensis]
MVNTGSTETRCLQCTLVGDAAIGKTSLIRTYTDRTNNTPPPDTVFDNYAGTSTYSNQEFTISIFDCSSKPDHASIRLFAYKDSDVFALCYSVMDRDSFEHIKSKWLPEVTNIMGKRVNFVLVATQIDLRESIDLDQDIPVSKTEGHNMAEEIGACSFIECSSSNQDNVQCVFEDVVQCVLKQKKKKHSIVQRIFGTK